MKNIISFYRSWILTFVPRICSLVALFLLLAASARAQEPEALATPAPETEQPLEPEQQSAPVPVIEDDPPPAPDEGTSPSDSDPGNAPSESSIEPPIESEASFDPPPSSGTLSATWASGEFDPEEVALLTPEVEIWRDGAEEPEAPRATGNGWGLVLVARDEPITVRLLFDPSLSGMAIEITPSDGVWVEPERTVNVSPSGDCLLIVAYDDSQEDGGRISFYSNQVDTELKLTTVPLDSLQQ